MRGIGKGRRGGGGGEKVLSGNLAISQKNIKVYFENILENPEFEISKISDFIYESDNSLSQERIESVVENVDFGKMKLHAMELNNAYHHILRKGKSDEWKELMNDEQSKVMDDLIVEKLSYCGKDCIYLP